MQHDQANQVWQTVSFLVGSMVHYRCHAFPERNQQCFKKYEYLNDTEN